MGIEAPRSPEGQLYALRGTISESTLIALINNAKKNSWKRLTDIKDSDLSAFKGTAGEEIQRVLNELHKVKGKKLSKSLKLVSATLKPNGREYRVIKVCADNGDAGFAPIANPMVSDILAEGVSEPQMKIRGEKILEIARKYDPKITIPDAIDTLNSNLIDLGALFGFNRQIMPEKWMFRLKPVHFSVPTPAPWGNGSIPRTRRRNLDMFR